MDDLKLIW